MKKPTRKAMLISNTRGLFIKLIPIPWISDCKDGNWAGRNQRIPIHAHASRKVAKNSLAPCSFDWVYGWIAFLISVPLHSQTGTSRSRGKALLESIDRPDRKNRTPPQAARSRAMDAKFDIFLHEGSVMPMPSSRILPKKETAPQFKIAAVRC